MTNFAIILSGCGVYDGSEIHEAVSALLALDEAGVEYQCFAPNAWQAKTIDHFTGHSTALIGDDDNRNILAESARIARGKIKDVAELKVREFDGIIFPGGMGAVTNLSNAAEKGHNCDVLPEVKRVIEQACENGVVIGAMCIAPMLIARVLGNKGISVTIGKDINAAQGIEKMGAKHVNCNAHDVCVDEIHKIVTTPAYMLAASIKDVAQGARNMVKEMINLI